MTPFGTQLTRVLRDRGITQTLLAKNVGIHYTYLSSVLHGRKGTPSEQLVNKIAESLKLSADERSHLEHAARISYRQVNLPETASEQERELVGQLMEQIGRLLPAQIAAISYVLELTPGTTHYRVR